MRNEREVRMKKTEKKERTQGRRQGERVGPKGKDEWKTGKELRDGKEERTMNKQGQTRWKK